MKKKTAEHMFAEYDREQSKRDIVYEMRTKTIKQIVARPVHTSLLKATTEKRLTKLACAYFKRTVHIDGPTVSVGSIGVLFGYIVEKKRKYYHLIKTV